MKQTNKSRERQGRWFTFVLYPENNAHRDILNYLLDEKVQAAQGFKVAGMQHARCVYMYGVKQGLPKKAHIHVIMKTETKHTAPAIAKMMGGQRVVLRLYQRDEKHVHSTKLLTPEDEKQQNQPAQNQNQPAQNQNQPAQNQNQPAQNQNQPAQQKPQQGITRTFSHRTGEEYPVLVDTGTGEPQPVDLDIPPMVWTAIESVDGHHWDSLPEVCYNNPLFPQFQCAENQYWKLVTKQDIAHAEVISDPKAYYLYLQHKDLASIRNGKTLYDESEFFGNEELLAELRGERGLKYQVSQLIEYFNAYGVTNGKQAYEALLYGDCTEELLKFYWNNTSKFSAYFRGMELELKSQIKEDENGEDGVPESIDVNHKRVREMHEYDSEIDAEVSKHYAKKFRAICEAARAAGHMDDSQREALKEIHSWFSRHPDMKHFCSLPYEERVFNDELRACIMSLYDEPETVDESVQAPLAMAEGETADEADDTINWDDCKPFDMPSD